MGIILFIIGAVVGASVFIISLVGISNLLSFLGLSRESKASIFFLALILGLFSLIILGGIIGV